MSDLLKILVVIAVLYGGYQTFSGGPEKATERKLVAAGSSVRESSSGKTGVRCNPRTLAEAKARVDYAQRLLIEAQTRRDPVSKTNPALQAKARAMEIQSAQAELRKAQSIYLSLQQQGGLAAR